ncbi:MAG: response regulator [Tidjanibacter sp.]|nr:response regulator [Tidjanibacter sp.]
MIIKYNSRGKELKRFVAGQNGMTTHLLTGLVAIDDKVWVGTRGDGIMLIDINTDQIEYIKHQSGANQNTIPGNYVNHIQSGNGQYVWASTQHNGVVGIKPASILSYSEVQRFTNMGLSHQTVLCFYDDYAENQIIIGTCGGVNFYNPTTELFRHLPIYGSKVNILAVTRLDSNTIMVAVDSDGIYMLNDKTGKIVGRLNLDAGLNKRLFGVGANISLIRDNYYIYILGREIVRYSLRAGSIEVLKKNPLSGEDITPFDSDDERVKFFADSSVYQLNKSAFSISCLYHQDEKIISADEGVLGHLVIVDKNGLKVRNPDCVEFVEYNAPFQYKISSVQIDNRRRLWIAAENTIMCNTDRNTEIFRVYSTTDGVLKSAFFQNAMLVSRRGDIYFGGEMGFVRVLGDIDLKSYDSPKMRLLSWRSDSDFVFEKDTKNNLTLISLPSDYHDITVRVSAVGFDILRHNYFRFNIIGPVNTEITSNSDSFKFNMPEPGTYRMSVSCSTDSGIWSTPETLAIINVARPWYLQWWAIAILIVVFVFVGSSVVFHELENKQRAYDDMLRQKEAKEQQNKLNIFADISHELHTPLTLVYSPLKRLIDESPQSGLMHERLEQMMIQVKRMTRLTSLIIDVRKMENGLDKMAFVLKQDVNSWVRFEAEPFRNELAERHMTLDYDLHSNVQDVVYDPSKLRIVISNLMSNALKYGNPNTSVLVRSEIVEADGVPMWRVSVVDRGIGLVNKDIESLFVRFVRGDNVKNVAGYGVGLSYSRDIVLMHHGQVSAYDADGLTTFYFDIPLDLSESTIRVPELSDDSTSPSTSLVSPGQPQAPTTEQQGIEQETILSRLILCSLLIVEDDRALREYMKEEFSHYFRKVYTAADGAEGIERVRQLLPDLVISDVVMPNISGLEMCRQIKTDLNISHIPVLLLTARTDDESVSKGYKMGADMYMTKPFDVDTMLTIVYNHLQ